jgi:hypothetical protein
MTVPVWVLTSLVSGCITMGFLAGVFTTKFMSKHECETFRNNIYKEMKELQKDLYNKIGEIFDKIEDIRVDMAGGKQ